MRLLIVGASSGLGRALFDGLAAAGHDTVGVSRSVPADVDPARWIAADFSDPATAADTVVGTISDTGGVLDGVLYNLGVWEPTAFSDDYDFAAQDDAVTLGLLASNVAGPILLLQRLMPLLLAGAQPRVILTGSTSGLPRSGRPEVAFGASKAALNGIADALRARYHGDRLGVTTLQLGYLNTDDTLSVPRAEAAARGEGTLIPVHDVVAVVTTLLGLSPASTVRELVMPAILDDRF